MTNYRVFDGHCDTPIELWLQNQPLLENTLAVSLARAQRLGTWAQFFAFCTAWVKAKLPRPEIFSRALENFHAQLCENEDKITLCAHRRDGRPCAVRSSHWRAPPHSRASDRNCWRRRF